MARTMGPKKPVRNAASSSNTRSAGQASTAAAAASANSPTGSDNTMTGGSSSGKRRDNNFLEKLWNFLEDDVSKPVMAFSTNGKFLVITDPETVPKLLAAANICKHKDYGSFQRQMCIYGWKRISQSDISKVVLIDGEEPGATVAQLGSHIKIMQHEILERDSPMDEVKAVPRKAKPKASRAKDGGIAAAAKAAAAAANAADGLAQNTSMDMSTFASTSTGTIPVPSSRKPSLRASLNPSLSAAASAHGTNANPVKRVTRGSSNTIKVPKKRRNDFAAATDEVDQFLADPSQDSSMDEDLAEDQLSDMELEALVAEDDIKVKEEMDKRSAKHRRTKSSDIPTAMQDLSFSTAFGTTSNPFPAQHTMPMAPISAPLQPTSQLGFQMPSASIPVPIPGAQQNQNGQGAGYASLPKSLQEAFLILDNFKPSSTGEGVSSSDQMIDPALTGGAFDSSSILPPLPPIPSTSSSLSNIISKNSNDSNASTGSSLSHLVNTNASGAEDPTIQHMNDPTSSMLDVQSGIPPPFYYQPPPGGHFPQRDQNQPAPQPHRPYFASAFSGLADMHTSPSW